jgi:hypothetical protein
MFQTWMAWARWGRETNAYAVRGERAGTVCTPVVGDHVASPADIEVTERVQRAALDKLDYLFEDTDVEGRA